MSCSGALMISLSIEGFECRGSHPREKTLLNRADCADCALILSRMVAGNENGGP